MSDPFLTISDIEGTISQTIAFQKSIRCKSLIRSIAVVIPPHSDTKPLRDPPNKNQVSTDIGTGKQRWLPKTKQIEDGAQDSVDSSVGSLSDFPRRSPEELDDYAKRILKIHFVSRVLSDLLKIQQVCEMPEKARSHVENMLSTMRTMREMLPFDPFLDVVMALHNAMAFRDSWVNYKLNQYTIAYDILKTLAKSSNPSFSQIGQAVVKLEERGFDTIPFGEDIDGEMESIEEG